MVRCTKSFTDICLYYDCELHFHTLIDGILCTCCEECDGCAEEPDY